VIVLVHGLRAWGAVERYVAALVRAAPDELVLVYPGDPVLEPFEQLGARTVRYPAELLGSAPRLTLHLARVLRKLAPRAVHVTDVLPPALVAARLAGVRRLLLTHHTPELPRVDNAAGRLWLRVGWLARPTVIYTSEADRERDGRSPSTVVPLGIDLERFGSGRPVLEGRMVGNVARLVPQKGQRFLLEAIPRVVEHHADARFVIVGEGELRAELERHAQELGVADRVLFTGSRDDVPDLLASFELFAFPSLFEGLCLAVIEAQAAGVPVVATPVGGIRETVVDGETGFLVPVQDAAALAERISWCLDHPGEARRVAENARRRVLERHSEHAMVERTLKLYRIPGPRGMSAADIYRPMR
jgi:glycosyltransferase involved in cell wall biosynthesis